MLTSGLLSFLTHEVSYSMFRQSILDTELKYYCAAIYSVVGSFICCWIDIAIATLPVFFMAYAIAFLKQLSRRLEKIGNEIIIGRGTSIEQEKKHQKELIDCIKIHLRIKEFVRGIEKHFSTIILVQGLLSSIIFCTIIYGLSTVI